VRFWGKLLGTGGDYYVVECKMNTWPEEAAEVEEKAAAALSSASGAEKKAEERKEGWGSGANEFAYFVASNPGGKWTRLPLVLPEQIIIARQTRRFLTGDVKSPVLGFPRFPWPEASYLRAQIARISAATIVSPKGFYALDDEVEEETLVEEEEFKGVHPLDLLQPDNWSHHRAFLLRQGRTQPFEEEPKEDTESNNGKKQDEEEEPDEPISLLGSLDKDESTCKLFLSSSPLSPLLLYVYSRIVY
jgi:radial spoke head protein 4A